MRRKFFFETMCNVFNIEMLPASKIKCVGISKEEVVPQSQPQILCSCGRSSLRWTCNRRRPVIAVLDDHRSLVTVSYVPESQNPAPDYLSESRRQRNLQKSTSQWVLQIHLHKSTNPFARSNMLADFCPAEYAADLKSLSSRCCQHTHTHRPTFTR